MKKKDYLRRLFELWTYRLGLRWWTVNVRYYDDPDEIVSRFNTGERTTLMRNTTDWQYCLTTIDVNLSALKQLDREEIERAVVHELIHALVNEMREGEIHHEERVVTQITNAIFWTVADVKEYRRKAEELQNAIEEETWRRKEESPDQ
jgi:hypothetical protein